MGPLTDGLRQQHLPNRRPLKKMKELEMFIIHVHSFKIPGMFHKHGVSATLLVIASLLEIGQNVNQILTSLYNIIKTRFWCSNNWL